MDNRIILGFVSGCLLGLFLYDCFLLPDIDSKVEYNTVTNTKIERIPQLPELVFIRSPKAVYLRDTVINEVVYPLNDYEGLEVLKNGKITWSAQTSGYLNKIDLNYEGEKEYITNTVTNTKTVTNTVHFKGLYIGGGINSVLNYDVSASYIDKHYSFTYQYQPQTQIHRLGISKKLF